VLTLLLQVVARGLGINFKNKTRVAIATRLSSLYSRGLQVTLLFTSLPLPSLHPVSLVSNLHKLCTSSEMKKLPELTYGTGVQARVIEVKSQDLESAEGRVEPAPELLPLHVLPHSGEIDMLHRRVGGKSIDLVELVKLVKENGGPHVVTKRRGWLKMGVHLGIPSDGLGRSKHGATSSRLRLLHQYAVEELWSRKRRSLLAMPDMPEVSSEVSSQHHGTSETCNYPNEPANYFQEDIGRGMMPTYYPWGHPSHPSHPGTRSTALCSTDTESGVDQFRSLPQANCPKTDAAQRETISRGAIAGGTYTGMDMPECNTVRQMFAQLPLEASMAAPNPWGGVSPATVGWLVDEKWDKMLLREHQMSMLQPLPAPTPSEGIALAAMGSPLVRVHAQIGYQGARQFDGGVTASGAMYVPTSWLPPPQEVTGGLVGLGSSVFCPWPHVEG